MNGSATQRPAHRPLFTLTGLLVGAIALLLAPASLAAVYRCEGESGEAIFTDRACPDKVVGTIVEVQQANRDHGYDPKAKAKVRARARQEAHKFRNGWQAHNAEMKVVADKREQRRHRQYKRLREPVVKPQSKRKQKNPYSVVHRR